MQLNNIGFTDAWVKKFSNAEAFANDIHVQHHIESRSCTKDELILLYNTINGHDNKGLQHEDTETRPEQSGTASDNQPEGQDSEPAGDTDEQRAKA